MNQIPKDERPLITLKVVTCPEGIDVADARLITVLVRVENRSSLALSSTEPYPLHLASLWIHEDGTVEEGDRAQLKEQIEPWSTAECQIVISRPATMGKFSLRLTFVQEHICWFSDPPVSHFVDTEITVRSNPWWNSKDMAPIFGDNKLLNHRKFGLRLSFPGGNRPLMLTIETVNTCNFDCLFCPYGIGAREKSVMPLDLFELALDQYVAMGGGALSLTPMVGDVFLDRFLLERFRLIRQRQSITNVSFTTNASLFQTMTDHDFTYIVGQLYQIHISLYGVDAEEHRLITRRPTFERVIANVQRVVAAAGESGKISLGFRLLRERSQEFLSEWVHSNFGRALPFGSTTQYMNWMGALDTTIRLPFDARWIQFTGKRDQCFLPMVACHIYSNGDVSFCPCDDFNGTPDLHLGNIRKNSLSEIYNSEKVRQLWMKLPPACEGCTAYRPLSEIDSYISAFDDPIKFRGG